MEGQFWDTVSGTWATDPDNWNQVYDEATFAMAGSFVMAPATDSQVAASFAAAGSVQLTATVASGPSLQIGPRLSLTASRIPAPWTESNAKDSSWSSAATKDSTWTPQSPL